MATSLEYIEFVCEQLEEFENIRYRKMFGEYMVYVNDKPILLVCDNTVYIKMLDSLKEIMLDSSVGFPYEGAKKHYILDIENRDLLNSAVLILEKDIPIPKKKK